MTKKEKEQVYKRVKSKIQNKRKPKYSYEECRDASKKYPSKTQFKKHDRKLFSAAERYGWISDFVWLNQTNTKKQKTSRHIWTFKEVQAEAKKYTMLKDFRTKSPLAYYAAKHRDWMNKFTWLQKKNRGTAKSKHSLRQMEKEVKRNTAVWTNEKILAEAKKYKTLKDFHDGSCSAYQAAQRRKILKQFDWLEKAKRGRKFPSYTLEECKAEASKYPSKSQFVLHSSSYYKHAVRMGWFDNSWFPKKVKQTQPKNTVNWTSLRIEAVKTILPLVMQANPKGDASTLSQAAIKHVDEMIERVKQTQE